MIGAGCALAALARSGSGARSSSGLTPSTLRDPALHPPADLATAASSGGGGALDAVASLDRLARGDDGDGGDGDAMGGPKGAVEIASVTCGGGLMALSCEVVIAANASITSGPSEASVCYFPEATLDENMNAITTCMPLFSLSEAHSKLRIYRLRPARRYVIYARVNYGVGLHGAAVVGTTFMSSKTGVEAFDEGVFASYVAGSFTYEVAVTAYSTGNFQGLIALDSMGYVVWYGNASALPSWSRPHIVAFDRFEDGGYCVADSTRNTLAKLTKDGAVVGEHTFASHAHYGANDDGDATEGPYSNNTYHECRVTPEQTVLGVGQRYTRVPSFDVTSSGDTQTCDGVIDEVVYEWDPESDSVKEVLHVSDYIAWQDLISYYADTEESGILLERANNGFVQFYHTSSVSVSSDERLYIVSLRDINTILAINRDTLEKEWVISSTVPASYAFSSTFDKFYQPHDALYYPGLGEGAGLLSLMDDGNERAGCDTGDISEEVPDLCASRALTLSLAHVYAAEISADDDATSASGDDDASSASGASGTDDASASGASGTDDMLIASGGDDGAVGASGTDDGAISPSGDDGAGGGGASGGGTSGGGGVVTGTDDSVPSLLGDDTAVTTPSAPSSSVASPPPMQRALAARAAADNGEKPIATKIFDFSTPDQWSTASADMTAEKADVFNYDGGSNVLINGTGTDAMWLASFTDTDKSEYSDHSYIFQLNSIGSSIGEMQIPSTTWPDHTESGSYRVNPYVTIGGERSLGLSHHFTDYGVAGR